MWDLSTKVLVKLHGEMGMPGRKAERDQYGFFSPPTRLFSRRERRLVMKPPASAAQDYDCSELRYARSTSQSNTFIQPEQLVCLMNSCLEPESDLACSLPLFVCS